MVFHNESLRSQLIDSRGTCLNFKHSLAGFAQEVMMVMRMLTFVVRRSTGDFHDIYVAVIHEDTKRTVDCSDTEPGRQGTSHLPNFGGGHRASCVLERFLDC
jgi:hypothetical protein